MSMISTKDGPARLLQVMSGAVGRRDFVAGMLILALATAGDRVAGAAGKPTVQVHKSPT
jgi:hypothetical protein